MGLPTPLYRHSLTGQTTSLRKSCNGCGMPNAADTTEEQPLVFLFLAGKSTARMLVAPANHECFNS
eukprot:842144-Lingulodinium_polyedra.AAC.1